MTSQVEINPEFEHDALHSPAVAAMLVLETERVAQEARNQSSWGHGSIAEHISADVGIDESGRLVGRVNANDFKSFWFQAGTSKMAARPFLTDAATICGYIIEAASA